MLKKRERKKEGGNNLENIQRKFSFMIDKLKSMYFPPPFVLNLAVTCQPVFNLLQSYISDNLIFRFPYLQPPLKYYNPKKYTKFPSSAVDQFNRAKITFLSFVNSTFDMQTIKLLPKTITHLVTGDYFHLPVNNNLPASLTQLHLGHSFDYPVDHLPPSITHLILGNSFNQAIDYLPPGLVHLKLGYKFKQRADNLPETLTHLTFGKARMTFSLDNLPPSLIFLKIGLNCPPLDHLPLTLQHLELYGNFYQHLDYLPPALTHLIFHKNTHALPMHYLPTSITHLTVGSVFNSQLHRLPPSITHLSFGSYHSGPADGTMIDYLPPAVTHLHILGNFNENVDYLPMSITHLTFPDSFNQPVDNLPASVLEILFRAQFDQPVDNLPNSVTRITFSNGSNFNFPVDNLPTSLTHLRIESAKFKKPINFLPSSLTHLTLLTKYKGSVKYIARLVKVTRVELIKPPSVTGIRVSNEGNCLNNIPYLKHPPPFFFYFKFFYFYFIDSLDLFDSD